MPYGSPAVVGVRAAVAAISVGGDAHLLDRVIDGLRRLSRGALLQYALQVGSLLLDSFWAGDPSNYRDKQKAAGTGFGALLSQRSLELKDLQLSASTLRNYVRATIVWRQLPLTAREHLDLADLRALALLKNPEVRAAIALEVAEADLCTRDLESKVAHARRQLRKGAVRGRKPVPPPIKCVRQLCRDAAKTDPGKFSDEMARLPAQMRADLRTSVQQAQQRLEQLLNSIPLE